MKKKIKWFLIMSVMCVFMLCGCSRKEKATSKEQVEAFLTKYQQQDSTCGEYLEHTEADSDVEFEGFQAVLASTLEYEIKSVEIEEDYNTVNVVVSNVDFGTVMDELVQNELEVETQEDILNELEKRLLSKNATRREFEVAVKVTKDYRIQMTGELSNALLGGYTQYIYELTTGDVYEENN